MFFRTQWRRWLLRHSPADLSLTRARILVVVEGPHDIEFLCRISTILSLQASAVPNLAQMERRQQLVFIPFGGGDLSLWTIRLEALRLPEFHLYDRESGPETEVRQQLARTVNLRPGCQAVVTSKRSLENYLHPEAIREACGVELSFGDDDHVADLIAARLVERQGGPPLADSSRRAQVRRRNRVKKWLHTKAMDRMTPQRLAERDPQGEVASWLAMIGAMAGGSE